MTSIRESGSLEDPLQRMRRLFTKVIGVGKRALTTSFAFMVVSTTNSLATNEAARVAIPGIMPVAKLANLDPNNQPTPTGFIAKPVIVTTVITPTIKFQSSTIAIPQIPGNLYPYGYCTWWAKLKRPDLPNNLGNAGFWLQSAQQSNLTISHTPKVGAIVVTNESFFGHVGYVEAIDGNEIITSDMNLLGWNKNSSRRLPINAPIIKGYIN